MTAIHELDAIILKSAAAGPDLVRIDRLRAFVSLWVMAHGSA